MVACACPVSERCVQGKTRIFLAVHAPRESMRSVPAVFPTVTATTCACDGRRRRCRTSFSRARFWISIHFLSPLIALYILEEKMLTRQAFCRTLSWGPFAAAEITAVIRELSLKLWEKNAVPHDNSSLWEERRGTRIRPFFVPRPKHTGVGQTEGRQPCLDLSVPTCWRQHERWWVGGACAHRSSHRFCQTDVS